MLSFVPRRNLRRALLLLLALVGVLSMKMTDGCNLLKVMEVVAPEPAPGTSTGVMHLRVNRPDARDH